jgi:hypothetical protein
MGVAEFEIHGAGPVGETEKKDKKEEHGRAPEKGTVFVSLDTNWPRGTRRTQRKESRVILRGHTILFLLIIYGICASINVEPAF